MVIPLVVILVSYVDGYVNVTKCEYYCYKNSSAQNVVSSNTKGWDHCHVHDPDHTHLLMTDQAVTYLSKHCNLEVDAM